jgi:hypothetical protein
MRLYAAGLASGILSMEALSAIVPPGMEPWLTVAAVAALSWAALSTDPA